MISPVNTNLTPQSKLKIVKKKTTLKKVVNGKKIYINTLFPGFSYTNGKGELITPQKCAIFNM